MKKIIIFILIVFVLVLSGCKDNQDNTKKQIYNKENYIATMDFFTSDGSYNKKFLLMNLGHSFLRIINETPSDLLVGEYTLAPYEEITIGLWSITTKFGVWYNLDSFFTFDDSRYSDRVALRTTLTKEDIEKINEFLKNDPKWTPTYNCSQLCMDIWNITNIDDNFSLSLATPGKIKKIFEGYVTLSDITILRNDNIGYFKDGKFILCELV